MYLLLLGGACLVLNQSFNKANVISTFSHLNCCYCTLPGLAECGSSPHWPQAHGGSPGLPHPPTDADSPVFDSLCLGSPPYQ